MKTAYYESPIGKLIIGEDERGICLLKFADGECSETCDGSDSLYISEAVDQLKEYFAGERDGFDVPLSLAGTDFQQRVWATLVAIPYGESLTYRELAEAVGRPKAVRAAGSACGKNPVMIIVPCHRVLRSDGSLGGFAGGIERKKLLRDLEKEHL